MRSRLPYVLAIAWLLAPVAAAAITPQELIEKMDEAEYGAKDSVAEVKMIIIEKDGKKSERKMKMYQRGSDKRLIKFLSPADVKGIGFLDEGDDKMYVYMPAFHKTRRIAGHVKNENFAGTDFSHDDLSTERFCERLIPKDMKEEGDHYVLEAAAKPDPDSQWKKLKFHVRKKDFLFDRVEYYDEKGEKAKVFARKEFKPVGDYIQSFWAEMKDVRSGHTTRMIVENIEMDTGLSSRMFSKRQLKRL